MVVVPVAVVSSPKFHWVVVMLPVDELASKETVSGAVPVSGAAAMAALSAEVSVVVVVPPEVLPTVELVSSVVEVGLSPLDVESVVVGVVVVVSSVVLPAVELVPSVVVVVLSPLDVVSVSSVVLVSPVLEVVLSPLDVVSVDEEVVVSVKVSTAAVKGKGAVCGLSVPSLKVAVMVKLVVSAVSVTVQSMAVALVSCVWQIGTPSW